VPEQPADCTVCGASIPADARFCPACGTPVRGDTVQARTRWFGLTPPTLVLGLAALLLVVALVLLALGSWVAGLLVLGLALLCAAAFLEAGRRKPDTEVARSSVGAVDRLRARAGFTARSLRARSSAQREVTRRRSEALRLTGEREQALRALGEAVYRGDDGVTERARVEELDERLASLEREIGAIAAQTRNRVEEARLEVQKTEVVRPPDHD
jgi:hypothetical protein